MLQAKLLVLRDAQCVPFDLPSLSSGLLKGVSELENVEFRSFSCLETVENLFELI